MPKQIVNAHIISRVKGNSKSDRTAAHMRSGKRLGSIATRPIFKDLKASVIITKMINAAIDILRLRSFTILYT